jgi:hypothetical protein
MGLSARPAEYIHLTGFARSGSPRTECALPGTLILAIKQANESCVKKHKSIRICC